MRRTHLLAGASAAALLLGGVGSPAGAIFSGSLADASTNPAMAYVTQQDSSTSCGGVLVSPTQVLTAAHCVTGEGSGPISSLVVILEVTDLEDVTPEDMHHVAQVHVHPSYDEITGSFDIAVLTLAAAVDTPVARVVSDSEDALWAPGTVGTITGWGLTSNDGGPATDLQVGEVPIRADSDCPFAGSPGTLFCAGADADSAVQACQGDSGGPLIVRDHDDEPVVVGLVVLGDGLCGGTNFIDAYARIGDDPLNSWLALLIESPADTSSPRVVGSSPTGKRVKRSANVSVTFDEQVDPGTVTRQTFVLQRVTRSGSAKVRGVVTLTPNALTARLDPFGAGSKKLARASTYRVTVTTAVTDVAGNQLDQSAATAGLQKKTWTFRTRR